MEKSPWKRRQRGECIFIPCSNKYPFYESVSLKLLQCSEKREKLKKEQHWKMLVGDMPQDINEHIEESGRAETEINGSDKESWKKKERHWKSVLNRHKWSEYLFIYKWYYRGFRVCRSLVQPVVMVDILNLINFMIVTHAQLKLKAYVHVLHLNELKN